MADFGARWKKISDLGEGGQAHTFVVQRADDSLGRWYVAKRLKNLKRSDRFEREIQAVERLVHPHILSLVDRGTDQKGRPFIVTEHCSTGNLRDCDKSSWTPLRKLELFYKVCDAVNYAHAQGVIHRDIKPENIFLRSDESPVLGDFGICYVEDDGELTITEEVMGSRFYCAPELRDGRVDRDIPAQLADIYSLGKLLYWLFTERVFDGHEETYGDPSRSIARALASTDSFVPDFDGIMAASLVDDLAQQSVVRDPRLREIRGAFQFMAKVAHAMERIRASGSPLDLRLPKRCLFCGEGQYRPAHLLNLGTRPGGPSAWSDVKTRKDRVTDRAESNYVQLREVAADNFGFAPRGGPLVLICGFCGNVQQFRVDLTDDGYGMNWRP